jgi:predicted nucleic acid-binding protein
VILVDTSVWIEHLRHGEPRLASALDAGEVLTHPFVIGELACGNLGNRMTVLELLHQLPAAREATHAEVLAFIDRRKLFASGIGYVDAHLLAATALTSPASLWTLDKRLARVARPLGLT